MAADLYIGIDAGGTATRAAMVSSDGQLLATGVGDPTKHLVGPRAGGRLERILQTVSAPLVPLIGGRACIVLAGVTGISVPGKHEAFTSVLRSIFPAADLRLTHDAQIAAAGALGSAPGVAVLAGSGSVALARNANGDEATAGGYGYLLGDEGSGFWLGRRALDSVLRGDDGRAPATRLEASLRQHAQVPDVQALPGWVYTAPHPIERVSALAPLVAQAAWDGDAVAIDLLHQAGTQLAELAAAAARSLWPDAIPLDLPVARCGRVWCAGALLRDPFAARLAELLPRAHPIDARLSPLGGAVVLAMRSDGRQLAAADEARLESLFRTHQVADA